MTAVAGRASRDNPPTPSHTEWGPAATARRTTWVRPLVRPILVPGPGDGVAPDDEYVRRYWVAAVGPTAVTDLLRLIAAARRKGALARPTHLSTLLAEGLAWSVCGRIIVPRTIPRIGARSIRRLPLALQRELRPFD